MLTTRYFRLSKGRPRGSEGGLSTGRSGQSPKNQQNPCGGALAARGQGLMYLKPTVSPARFLGEHEVKLALTLSSWACLSLSRQRTKTNTRVVVSPRAERSERFW